MGAMEFSVTVKGKSAHASEFEKTQNPIKTLFNIVGELEAELSRPVNIIMIRGGSEHYVVPQECKALLEVKIYEGEDLRKVEERIGRVLERARGDCDVSYRVEDAEEFIAFRCGGFLELLEEVHESATGEKPPRGVMPSWTDASNYHRAGLSCVVFGYGSLKESHTPEEFLTLEELERMVKFFLTLFEKLR